MHQLQKDLLSTLERENLSGKTLREMCNMMGVKSAQNIKHHLSQLAKKGFIIYDPKNREIRKICKVSKEGIISLPIVGPANCGVATIFADQNIIKHLRVSEKFVLGRRNLFVLCAEGNSMNRSNIRGKNIEDGDFIIVDPEQRTPETGHYVVSIIDEFANVKKFVRDQKNKRVILRSESTEDFPPIFIHEDDKYEISGRVVDIFKKDGNVLGG